MSVTGDAEPTRTASAAESQRIGRWRSGKSTSARPTGYLKDHAYGDLAAAGELEIAAVAWLQVVRSVAGRHRVVHTPSRTATPSAAIALQIAGTSEVVQYGRTARLVAGSWSVCSSREPYTLVSPAESQRLIILVPSDRIERGIDLRAVAARDFPGTSGVSRLAFGAANCLIEESASLGMVRADDLAASLSRLLNLAIYERTRAQPAGSEHPLADRIREYVAQHLHDPDLSLETIARDLNASKRSLHRAVSDVDGSIHNLIWHARLERCRDDLRDPAKSQQPIGRIAQSWGFKNSTHFSRAFRLHFGMSAREARRDALAG